jgi:hypothetical protein
MSVLLASALVLSFAPHAWDRPDADPFTGTRAEAVELLGIPGAPVDFPPDACVYRPIREGERIDAMTFGRDRVEYGVVAHPDRWPKWVSRMVEDCWWPGSNGMAYHILYPIVCGNWYMEVAALPPIGMPAGGLPEWVYPGWGEGGGYGSPGYGEVSYVPNGYNNVPTASYQLLPPGGIESPPVYIETPPGPPYAPLIPSGPNAPTLPTSPNTPLIPTPEPSSLGVVLAGLAILWFTRRRIAQ